MADLAKALQSALGLDEEAANEMLNQFFTGVDSAAPRIPISTNREAGAPQGVPITREVVEGVLGMRRGDIDPGILDIQSTLVPNLLRAAMSANPMEAFGEGYDLTLTPYELAQRGPSVSRAVDRALGVVSEFATPEPMDVLGGLGDVAGAMGKLAPMFAAARETGRIPGRVAATQDAIRGFNNLRRLRRFDQAFDQWADAYGMAGEQRGNFRRAFMSAAGDPEALDNLMGRFNIPPELRNQMFEELAQVRPFDGPGPGAVGFNPDWNAEEAQRVFDVMAEQGLDVATRTEAFPRFALADPETKSLVRNMSRVFGVTPGEMSDALESSSSAEEAMNLLVNSAIESGGGRAIWADTLSDEMRALVLRDLGRVKQGLDEVATGQLFDADAFVDARRTASGLEVIDEMEFAPFWEEMTTPVREDFEEIRRLLGIDERMSLVEDLAGTTPTTRRNMHLFFEGDEEPANVYPVAERLAIEAGGTVEEWAEKLRNIQGYLNATLGL